MFIHCLLILRKALRGNMQQLLVLPLHHMVMAIKVVESRRNNAMRSPYKKERPTKDGKCHHCKEEGHWKRNCPLYLVELMKKKKTGGQNVASTSLVLNICNTIRGLRGAKKLKRGSLYLYVGNGVRADSGKLLEVLT
ncbi:retrotransposon protein, putative, ty1-copia subclass [Tanacetum coccineum]